MAHENYYYEDANNCFNIDEWQERHPATRYIYMKIEKNTHAQCYDQSTGESWTKDYKYRWSYWFVLDWAYPDNNSWVNPYGNIYSNGWRSISKDGSEHGEQKDDTNSPMREKFIYYSSNSNPQSVIVHVPAQVVKNNEPYSFFEKYIYSASELGSNETYKEDTYEINELSMSNDRGDLWGITSQGKLTLSQIHAEVLPNTDTPMPTEWRLNENNKLILPVYRELFNNLGAFSGASNLNMLIIPNSVEELGKKTCYETALSEITLPEDCTYYATSFPTDCVVTGGQIKEGD